ncbi:NTE family protein [Pustulibacterium marinum]|uniref:NTE family protein n=1 Tax=Pustulibacterium marinum TaxID=1224947 RepID=A0A1I7HCA0_9FLAO|nr:patatin-like phospholipase family protein [Pustulibacterium marinum]SFU58350.1 NTE family protein [Pustulibacterium marinum]
MKKIVWLGFLLISTLSFAQNNQYKPKKDLKVGLVLSGGGAKGFAHIGALKVLEKAGVRVDYIGGTSMGAIVGALYASGYTPKEMDSIFNSVDFEDLIQDKLPRSAKTFYEKEDAERYAITLPFNGFKVGFPSSISKGQNIYNLLARLLSPVSNIDDFNKLPIPFFCMATDIETGNAVKLDHGYLPEAIQASGAFPSLFQPVIIEGKVLIDGGVVNNYPLEEVRKMGADIIIGIDVQDDLAKRDDLTSAIQVLLQINNYRTVHDMYKKKEKTDVYIHPNIDDFTVVSFDKGAEIIDHGEQAAMDKYDVFKEIALQQTSKRERKPCVVNDSVEIKGISINGNDRYSRAYILGKLRFRNGDKIGFEDLNTGIGNLIATNNFDIVRYKLRPFEDNRQQLSLYVKENNDRTLLRLGVHYDDLYKTSGLINVTRKNLLQDDDKTSFDFIIGDNVRYNFEYYVDKGFYISYGLRSKYNTFDVGIDTDLINSFLNPSIEGLNKINIDVSNWVNQIYFQTVLKEEFSVGIGAEHSLYKITTDNIVEGENQETVIDDSNYFSAFGYAKLDTYDNKYFPSSGLLFEGDVHTYLFSSDHTGTFDEFTMAKAKIGFATPIYENLSLNLNFEGGFKIGRTQLNTLDFRLGGYGNKFINNLIPFYGYDFGGFGGNSFLKALGTIDYKFWRRNHINFSANFANAGNYIFEDEWLTTPDFSGYAIGYGLDSFLGPMEVKYSWSPENSSGAWFFAIGYWF